MGITVINGWTGLVGCVPLLAAVEGWTGLENCTSPDISSETGTEICVVAENRFLNISVQDRASSVRPENRHVELSFVNRHIEMPPRNKCV